MLDNFQIFYRKIKYPRLEFRTGRLHLILPINTKPEPILAKHIHWIKKKQDYIKETFISAQNKKLIKRSENKFKKLVFTLVKTNAQFLNIKINKLYFRKMRTKWASLSLNKNMTINTLMIYLPQHLIDYIVYHELSHVYEKRHNENFWKVITKKYNNYSSLEKELFEHWILIHNQKELYICS